MIFECIYSNKYINLSVASEWNNNLQKWNWCTRNDYENMSEFICNADEEIKKIINLHASAKIKTNKMYVNNLIFWIYL